MTVRGSATIHKPRTTNTVEARLEQEGTRKDTYCAFLDLKAYDTIPRDTIWQRLHQVGISSKMKRVLMSLYDQVRCVVVEEEMTDRPSYLS